MALDVDVSVDCSSKGSNLPAQLRPVAMSDDEAQTDVCASQGPKRSEVAGGLRRRRWRHRGHSRAGRVSGCCLAAGWNCGFVGRDWCVVEGESLGETDGVCWMAVHVVRDKGVGGEVFVVRGGTCSFLRHGFRPRDKVDAHLCMGRRV